MEVRFDGERGRFIDVVSQGQEPRSIEDSEAPGAEAWSPGPILRNKAFPGWALLMNRDITAPIAWMETSEALDFETWNHRDQVAQLIDCQSIPGVERVKGMMITPRDRKKQEDREKAEADRVSKLTPEEKAAEAAAKKMKLEMSLARTRADRASGVNRRKVKVPRRIVKRESSSEESDSDSDDNSDDDKKIKSEG